MEGKELRQTTKWGLQRAIARTVAVGLESLSFVSECMPLSQSPHHNEVAFYNHTGIRVKEESD